MFQIVSQKLSFLYLYFFISVYVHNLYLYFLILKFKGRNYILNLIEINLPSVRTCPKNTTGNIVKNIKTVHCKREMKYISICVAKLNSRAVLLTAGFSIIGSLAPCHALLNPNFFGKVSHIQVASLNVSMIYKLSCLTVLIPSHSSRAVYGETNSVQWYNDLRIVLHKSYYVLSA